MASVRGEAIKKNKLDFLFREAFHKEKSQNCGLFPYGGGGAQPHSVAFGGVFPNIKEAILVDEISTKVRIFFFEGYPNWLSEDYKQRERLEIYLMRLAKI